MNLSQLKTDFNKLRTDFELYCKKNIEIKNKSGKLIKLKFSRGQKYLWKLFLSDLSSGKPIRWYVIKGRQMYSTTFFTALFYWFTSLFSNKNAVIIAQDEDAAFAVGGRIQNYYLRSIPLLKPSVRIMNRKQIHFANPLEVYKATGEIGLDSTIKCFSIDTKNLGRNLTIQLALLTEFSMYAEATTDMRSQLDGLFATIGDVEGTVIVLETTPKGENYAKDFWEDATNGYRKIFISWVSMDEYRIEISPLEYFQLSELDTEDSRYGNELAEREKIIAELKIWWPEINTPIDIEHEVYCRLAWRRNQIDKTFGGDRNKFKQEYPTSVQDAFTFSADTIFPLDRIVEMEKYITENPPKLTRFRYQHDDNEKDIKRKFYEAQYGNVYIYEEPLPNNIYVIGADGAQGIKGGDDSSCYILKLPELEEVASFSDIIIPDEFAGLLNALGCLYNNALLGCEINDKGGYAAIEKLYNFYNYPNLYYRPTAAIDNITKSNYRVGFLTNDESRQIMINDFTVLLKNADILIKSKKLLTQLKTFVMIKGKAQAMPGKHDDLVIGSMIAAQMARKAYIPQEPIKPKVAPRNSIEWHLQRMNQINSNREIISRRVR